jgi:hypothetical protein
VIGRVLSAVRAGEAQAHPCVRWGGLPGRRSHSSKTYWALGLISTVRIGAGAWRKWAHTRESGDTDQAGTQIHSAQKRTQEGKENRAEAFKERTTGPSQRKKPGSGRDRKSTAGKEKPDGNLTTLLTTLIGARTTCCTAWSSNSCQWCLPMAYSRIRRCCLMVRGGSVNQKTTATITKTTSKPMITAQTHSVSENDSGQPCQNGNEAPNETKSQRHESKPKNRVLGLRTTSRAVQLPVSKLSGYDSI